MPFPAHATSVASCPSRRHGFVDHHHHGEALALVRERARLQPVIARRLATGELRDVVCVGQQLRRRQAHSQGALRFSTFTRAVTAWPEPAIDRAKAP
jgi:hypothetical protein